ncbi:MAG: hypothetical protein KF690_01490 [Bacteroidetes bacterium]|nr:hypothetical protein [Bacteroidota bacterium]
MLFILLGANVFAQSYNYEIRMEKRRGGADSLLFDIFIINKQATPLEIGSGDIPIEFTVADWAAISNGVGARLVDTTGSRLNGTSDWEFNPAVPYEPMVLSVSSLSRRLIVRFIKSYVYPSPGTIPTPNQFLLNDTVKIGTIYARAAATPYCEVDINPQFVIAGTIGSWDDDGFGNPVFLIHQTISTPIVVTVARTSDAPLSTRLERSAGIDSTIYVDTLELYAEPLMTGETGLWSAHGASTATFDTPSSPTSIVRNLGAGGLADTLVWSYTVTANGCVYTDTVVVTSQLWAIDFPLINDTLCGSAGPYTLLDASSTIVVSPGTWSSNPPGSLLFAASTSPTSSVSVAPGFPAGTYGAYWTADPPLSLVDSVDLTFVFTEAGGDSVVCGADSLILYADPVAVSLGVGGIWVAEDPINVSFDTPASPTSVARALIPGTYKLYWRTDATVGSCGLVQDSLLVTFHFAEAGTSPIAVCNDSTYTFEAAAVTGGVWSAAVGNPGVATITDVNLYNSTVSVNTPGLYKFYWGYNAGVPCGIVQDSVEIDFAFVEAGTTPVTVCNDSTYTFDATAVTGGVWSAAVGNPGVATIATPGSEISTVSVNTPGVYKFYWSATIGACSAQDSVEVTFAFAEAGTTPAAVCNDSTYTFDAEPLTGGAWSAAVSNPGVATIATPGSETSTVSVNTPGVYKFYWSATVGACSVQDSVEVTFAFVEAGTTPVAVCNDSTYTFDATAVTGGVWSAAVGNPGVATIATPGSETSTVSVSIAGTYKFYWSATMGACSAQDSIEVTFAFIEAGTSPMTVCDSTYIMDAPALIAPVTIGTWSQVSGLGTATFTDASSPVSGVTVDVPGTYRFYWTGNVVGACTPVDSVDITFNFVTAGPDLVLCDANTAGLAGFDPTIIGASGGQWSVIASPGGSGAPVFSNDTAPTSVITVDTPGSYTLRWQSTGTLPLGCVSHPFDDVTVVFNYVSAGPDSNICGLSVTLEGSDALTQLGVSANWLFVSGPGSPTYNPGNSTYNTAVTVDVPGTYVFRWQTTAPGPGCSVAHSDDVTLNFAVAAAGADQNICTDNTTLNATPVTSPYIGTWVPITAGFTVTDPSDPNSLFTTTSVPGTPDSLMWSVSDGFCVTYDTLVITSNRVDLKTVEGDTSFCGTDTPVIRILASDAGVSYTAFDGITPLSSSTPGNGSVLMLPLTLFPASGNITVTVTGQRTVPFTCTEDMANTVVINRTTGLGVELTVFMEGCIDTTGSVPMNFALLNSTYTLLTDVFGDGSPALDPTGFVQPADSNTVMASLPIDAVDVLKLEIRSSATGPAIDSAYAWLMADGSVRDFATATNPAVNFCDGNPDGNYYIVVRHKNHLPIMSSVAVPLNSVVPSSWSFNNPANYYQDPGLTPAVAIINRNAAPAYVVYAMLAGNVYDNAVFNDVGEVNAADFFRTRVAAISNPSNVYTQTDASLDGDLNAFDVTIVRTNNNDLRITSVPNP